MATNTSVKKVSQKGKDGILSSPVSFGVSFDNVVDERVGKGNYSLAQLFDSYMDFIQNSNFVYSGPTTPVNAHTTIWIDTAHTNHDTYGVK